MLFFFTLFLFSKNEDVNSLLAEVSNLKSTVSELKSIVEGQILSNSLSTLRQSLSDLRTELEQLYSYSYPHYIPRKNAKVSFSTGRPFLIHPNISSSFIFNNLPEEPTLNRAHAKNALASTGIGHEDSKVGSIFIPPTYYNQTRSPFFFNGRAQAIRPPNL